MGCGKSTIANKLSKKYRNPFVDLKDRRKGEFIHKCYFESMEKSILKVSMKFYRIIEFAGAINYWFGGGTPVMPIIMNC
jgi:shikimate kinase